MLHQMSTASCTKAGELATVARPPEGRPWPDSDAWEETADDTDLPQCKIKRNYNCTKCTFYTQNPRAFLQHSRDVHFEKFKIYDCSFCVYASRHHQKLIRHMKMVHSGDENNKTEVEHPPPIRTDNASPQPSAAAADPPPAVTEETAIQIQDFEDMLEEVEDSDGEDDNKLTDQFNSVSGQTNSCFCCNKCNYVTHIRSRFTKHVRYHTMPLIKCTICDFRTPYKWNLDRHMKNHGGTGCFHCSMCNFTADIKQSLTVHEMNHHVPAVGTSGQSAVGRRRNRVGASDATNALIAKEEEGSGDSRSSHTAPLDNSMGALDADVELVSCNSESNDATAMDASQLSNDATNYDSTNQYDESKSNKQSRKAPRPIPQLIPLNTSTPGPSKPTTSGEPPIKKFKDNFGNATTLENLPSDTTVTPVAQNALPAVKDTPARKKNNSFFDRLKERLLTETGENGTLTCKSCGFESKCLSEHSVHEKNCSSLANKVQATTSNTSLSSTRCQNCRHRCKSSADLFVHLKTCGKTNNEDSEKPEEQQKNSCEKNEDCSIELKQDHESTAPHPMENVVFVWNNISQTSNKFEMPLDISINDDSTLPEVSQSYDPENVEDNDGMILSPTQAIGKKVFKCPQCPFWASTASRFHVHIVGHLNKKPFECSLCKYKSNWRWDITKHIKLKSARDPEHNTAKVLMTDETGRRNYSKYNKFLAMPIVTEAGVSELIYIDQDAANNSAAMDIDEAINEPAASSHDMQPLDLHTQHGENDEGDKSTKPKKTLWKCKKCNYKDPLKAALLEHVRICNGSAEEPKLQNGKLESTRDPSELAYRCGHCHQLSNWKHVIQRHCRLKHDGNIKVIAIERPKQDTVQPAQTPEIPPELCPKCPFKSSEKKQMALHLQQHMPSPQSIFKCYFCPYFVKNEIDLVQHLTLHGIADPEDYIAKAMGGKTELFEPLPLPGITKRHKCTECPYETNSRSQFIYHEQFHRLPADTPYKCQECNYSVSKRHLLHQHMRVHGIVSKKDGEPDNEASTSTTESKTEQPANPAEIPYVWVSAKNEFHKMYKCRYCSYVNSQKCKIPNHEKIHCITFDNRDAVFYKCLECKFTCDNAGRLSQHSKTHGEMYGRIYCSVDLDTPDEEQIQNLRKQIEEEKIAIMEGLLKDEAHLKDTDESKLLFFCQKCPARFFSEAELNSHDSFHDQTFPNKCKNCEYSVPLENKLNAHLIVHTDEYQSKTKMLKMVHETHPNHQKPILEFTHTPASAEITWVVSQANKLETVAFVSKKTNESKHAPKQYYCKECPAKFFKNSALSYHMALHGSEGEYKCKFCSYAVKNIGNLAKHELLHDSEGKTQACDYESGEDSYYKNVPLSGTDLFQRKTEAQKRSLDKTELVKPNDHFPPVLQADPQFGYLMHGNPEFIYPTYLKNGRQREKRYKCHKCPSAFEKREQYKIHLSLHGSKQRYKCELCDYSVKYYANYVQHMRKHQMNDEAKAERKKGGDAFDETESQEDAQEDSADNIKLAIKTMPKGVPKSDFQLFSVSDQQTLRLLQRRRSINNMSKEVLLNEVPPTKDRKLHMCTLCPYTNQRQDSLQNHYKRHNQNDVLNAGYNKCPHCDLVVVQSNFLRDHIKAHFAYQKHLTPQCFVANEGVTFTLFDDDDENASNSNLEIDTRMDIDVRQDDKVFVRVSSGEIIVE